MCNTSSCRGNAPVSRSATLTAGSILNQARARRRDCCAGWAASPMATASALLRRTQHVAECSLTYARNVARGE